LREDVIFLHMSDENIKRQLEFIVEHQAKFSLDIAQLNENQSRLEQSIERLTRNVESLTSRVDSLTSHVEALTADVQSLTGIVASMQDEMRDGFNNLILANEVTRELANNIGKLAVSNSKRITILESQER
jgi:chromosome segregation ATPase